MGTELKPNVVQPEQKSAPESSESSTRDWAELIVASRPGLSVEEVMKEIEAH